MLLEIIPAGDTRPEKLPGGVTREVIPRVIPAGGNRPEVIPVGDARGMPAGDARGDTIR